MDVQAAKIAPVLEQIDCGRHEPVIDFATVYVRSGAEPPYPILGGCFRRWNRIGAGRQQGYRLLLTRARSALTDWSALRGLPDERHGLPPVVGQHGDHRDAARDLVQGSILPQKDNRNATWIWRAVPLLMYWPTVEPNSPKDELADVVVNA